LAILFRSVGYLTPKHLYVFGAFQSFAYPKITRERNSTIQV
jgi:hypothetical protein